MAAEGGWTTGPPTQEQREDAARHVHDAVGALNAAYRRAEGCGLEVRLEWIEVPLGFGRWRVEVWQRLKPL